MGKTKTALQIAIEWIEKEKKNVSNREKVSENWTADDQLQLIGDMLKGLIPTERQLIEDSWRDGYYKMGGETTTDYFTSKYGDNG